MRKLRVLALASVTSVVAMSGLMVACGDDDTNVPPRPDAGEGGSSDARPDQDVGDGAVDAKPDAPPVEDFVGQIEAALCSSVTRCCFGEPNPVNGGALDGGYDGGPATYNAGKCKEIVKNIAFEYASTGASFLGDGGALTIDAAKATQCVQQVKALGCQMTGTELAAARKTCFEAFIGGRDNGQPCRAAIECKPGLFCSPTDGKCAPLRGEGQPCAIYSTPDAGPVQMERDSYKSEEACSWRGSADTKLRCDSYDFVAGEYRPYAAWTCKPQVNVDDGCNDTRWCKDSICNEDYVCKSPVPYFAQQCSRVIDQP